MTDGAPLNTNPVPSAPAKKGRGSRRPPRVNLKIVLDTNQLYTGSASDLLQGGLRAFIEACRAHQDIDMEWFVPEFVKGEREYQMVQAAHALLPYLEKLEKLLGHNLAISREILESRVKGAIDRQVTELKLKVLPLEVASVDWKQVINDAINRNPPFERGKTEKGFRDRLIAESFLQLLRTSPKTPSVCRVVFVTADGLLADTIESSSNAWSNLRVLRSFEDLRGFVNTFVSSVTEDFVSSMRELARICFFEDGSKDGLFYTANVRQEVSSRFGEQLNQAPSGADLREIGTWYIDQPTFVDKRGQKITWNSPISIESTAYKQQKRPSTLGTLFSPSVSSSGLQNPSPTPPSGASVYSEALFGKMASPGPSLCEFRTIVNAKIGPS